MLFAATMINYMDRQVLSLTWKDFIAPDFHWSDTDFGDIAAIFSLVYAAGNLVAGRFIDWIGTKRGYLIAIGVWSVGACMHALCGIATMGWLDLGSTEEMISATGTTATMIATVSVWFFLASRVVLAIGESGNFPAAIKTTAEYFPKRDRAFATSIFNAGSTVGACAAPFCIPSLARYFKNIGWGGGWEMAFVIIGALGFVWMALWMWIYDKPEASKYVNQAELDYIHQEDELLANTGKAEDVEESAKAEEVGTDTQKQDSIVARTARIIVSSLSIFRHAQTWAILLARLFTDGVWWFLLFWTPAYLKDVFQLESDNPITMTLIAVLYLLTMLSIYGGKLPTIIMERTGMNAYESRLRALFFVAVIPLIVIFAQPLGNYSYLFPVILIGLAAAAHQSWSANIYSVISDLYPQNSIGTMTGICGLAAGIGSFAINYVSGRLFDYADQTGMQFLGFEGKPAGYFIIFCYCAVAYILGWCILKILVPKYNPVTRNV